MSPTYLHDHYLESSTSALPVSGTIAEDLKLLDACIHCGMCLPACPTYVQTAKEPESPRGRLYLMRAFFEGKLSKPQQLSSHLDGCLGCLSCQTACPSGVDYEKLLQASRVALLPTVPFYIRAFRRFMYQHVLTNQPVLKQLAKLVGILKASGFPALIKQIKPLAKLPLLGGLQFLPAIHPADALTPGMSFGQRIKGKVALFTGCVMDAAFTQTHWATIDVLVRNGYQVVIPPEQSCCGALAYHAGEQDIFEAQVAQNWPWMVDADLDYIVINSAGCGAALKDYSHFKPQDAYSKDAEALTTKIVDVMELLALHPLEGLNALPVTVTYHAACHLHHAQGVQHQPYQLLQQIPQLNLVPLTQADSCCGSAGVYNVAHPEMASAILAPKIKHILDTGAKMVLTGNPGCMIQLESGLAEQGVLVVHPVELLQMAYAKN